ncbi:hypothetical protein DY000_02032308 [Brassica cretica]|uniref:Uncharacterized protein n=1 Tax=Brassica cretica TaxID=69181 RepID=A0ABQ7DK44_BRACR|nr:hypothetical protein DY000_02061588 [Brassica cretica]KAF3577705.1 hypothetical protein DY000_02032308 [Brassica cretica]
MSSVTPRNAERVCHPAPDGRSGLQRVGYPTTEGRSSSLLRVFKEWRAVLLPAPAGRSVLFCVEQVL